MSSRVYIGGISYKTRERDLENFFRGFGRIREVLIKKGFAYVELERYRDAKSAIYELNGKKLLGRRVGVEIAKEKPRGREMRRPPLRSYRPRKPHSSAPVRTNYRVFVENLSSGVNWQDLKVYLGEAGEITFADAHKKYKNEGIVEFATYEDMKNAIRKFDDTVLNGRRIHIVEDKGSRKSHSGSRSRSRSASSSSYKRQRSKSRSFSPHDKKSNTTKYNQDDKHRSVSRSRSRSRSQKSRSVSQTHDQRDRRPRSKSPAHKRDRSRSASFPPPEKKKRDHSPYADISKLKGRSANNHQSRSSRSVSRPRSRSRSHSYDDKKMEPIRSKGNRTPSDSRRRSHSRSATGAMTPDRSYKKQEWRSRSRSRDDRRRTRSRSGSQ